MFRKLQQKSPPISRGTCIYYLFVLLYNYTAHRDPVTIAVTDLNPVQSLSISSHINIHSVVWSSNGVEFSKHPVTFSIINS